MRAISIHQPYASLIMKNIKIHETRTWRAHKNMIGKTIAIHASKTTLSMCNFMQPGAIGAARKTALQHLDADLPYGAIIGTVRISYIIACCGPGAHRMSILEKSLGNWSPGNFAWRLADITPIDPIPWKGQQGWFNVADELITNAQKKWELQP